jgi:glyoxylase-like metal-dependent hydrolase (beta-lactamase superfamily II)
MSIKQSALIRLGGIGLGLAGLWLMWPQGQQQPLTMEKITPNLWVIISSNSGNVAVMPTSEGVLLVDDKFEQDATEILAKVKSVSDKPIKYILNTHQHADHTGGNAMMLMKTPADILIQKNARANMVEGKQPGLPQITYGDEAQVFLGGREVSAHYFGRGHTNGDALILFPSERVLHTGDLYINGGAPLIDYSAKGTILDWDKTLEKALQLDFDIVIPGHGPVAKKADLAKWVKNMPTFRAHVKAACAGGAADAIKRLSPADVGTTPVEFLSRISMPGLCKELAN